MRPNAVKAALRGESPVFGLAALTGWGGMPRAVREAGFDFLLMDDEHRALGIETNQVLVAAARALGLTSIIRVTNAEYHLVARTMDLGADGVVVPRVESAETARDAVSWVKFPPVGRRGFGLARLATDFEPLSIQEAIEYWNSNSIVILQVETQRGVEAAGEIASVPGVDAVVIGPADLSIALGVPGQTDHPQFEAAVRRVIAACRQAGVASGVFSGNVATVRFWLDEGMRWFSCGTDEGIIGKGAADLMRQLRAQGGELP